MHLVYIQRVGLQCVFFLQLNNLVSYISFELLSSEEMSLQPFDAQVSSLQKKKKHKLLIYVTNLSGRADETKIINFCMLTFSVLIICTPNNWFLLNVNESLCWKY